MFLVLNPLYVGKVHVLSLNEFSVLKFQDLAEQTGIRIIPKYKKRGLDIPKLIMEQSSQRFYYTKLKRGMARKWGSSYRTFDIKEFGSSFLVDYKFSKAVEEKFLITEEDKNIGI